MICVLADCPPPLACPCARRIIPHQAQVSRDEPFVVPIGWITYYKPGMDDAETRHLVPVTPLQLTFDLKVHTANSLTRMLGEAQEGSKHVQRRRKDGEGLPFQVAGKRPTIKPEDGPEASRHRLVEKPASIRLCFNCFNAAFEVTHWTGYQYSFDKLPLEQAFDLLSTKSRRRIGRVKLAYTLGMTFLERVEFPNEWLLASEYKVTNDGWQGASVIEVQLEWGKEVATILITPWLAYATSIGARFMLRKIGAASGQCGTVQRILPDDRVVLRVDGYSKEDGVKGETLVDLTPANVCLTTGPNCKRDTRLIVLHNQKLVNASVLFWLGGTDHAQGSKHMVSIKSIGEAVGAQAWADLNQFNHIVVPPGVDVDSFEAQRMSYCKAIIETEDKVEDAITGNSLFIKDQLIFMETQDVPGGCRPPQYIHMTTVPELIKEMMEASPRRAEGAHAAQPVLVRAGPGTGKTWMIKQAFFLLAEGLADEEKAGEGVRLVPLIMFVQRIVRLLREHGDDAKEVLSNPQGLVRWYINSEFAHRPDALEMLTLSYEISALCILVDGVDEAAGMRDVVEAFVHYELVPSGNRIIITSRPEGVDLDDYKARFVITNLKELSQEQQRMVVKMQMKGNAFFDQLVNIAETRKTLDAQYKELFPRVDMRSEVEDGCFGTKELLAADEAAAAARQRTKEAREAREREMDKENEDGVKLSLKERMAELEVFDEKLRWDELRAAAVANRSEIAAARRFPRKLLLDSQVELQSLMIKVENQAKNTPRSKFLAGLHAKMMVTTDANNAVPLLELLESEIRPLPSPCTRKHVEEVVETMRRVTPPGTLDEEVCECLTLLTLQRKLPLQGGKRGSKAVPVTASGLWYQVLQTTEDRYLYLDGIIAPSAQLFYKGFIPQLTHLLGVAAAGAGIAAYALKKDAQTDKFLPQSAAETPTLVYCNPVALWLESTFIGSADTSEVLPTWCATVTLRAKSTEQFIELLRILTRGVEAELNGELLTLTLLELHNRFNTSKAHPAHLRNMSLHMLVTGEKVGSEPLLVVIEHDTIMTLYEASSLSTEYDFFWERVAILSKVEFESRLETLLVFLVEAIGVPVLLSLLLLTYSGSTSSQGITMDLNELPDSRHELYKMGIASGIKRRMALELNNESKKAAAAAEAESTQKKEEEEAKEGNPRRVKRKSTLEQNLGESGGGGGGGGGGNVKAEGDSKAKGKKGQNKDEPMIDLNSILRGKKVRVVVGGDDVAECYSLVARVLSKSKQPGFDLRSGIVAVVPKSHVLHGVVTAFVEYVLTPPSRSEQAWQDVRAKAPKLAREHRACVQACVRACARACYRRRRGVCQLMHDAHAGAPPCAC